MLAGKPWKYTEDAVVFSNEMVTAWGTVNVKELEPVPAIMATGISRVETEPTTDRYVTSFS